MLTATQRGAAIAAARTSIEARVARRTESATPGADDLPSASGVFVTVKVRGELRGCLGTLDCRRGVLDEIARCAADASSEDPRFAPITPAELPVLGIEVSILGPLERVDPFAPGAVLVGTHGLVVEQGRRRGLLLPQVAAERHWTAEMFLDHTCIKANLPPDAWRGGAVVYRFEAEVFGDSQNERTGDRA